ncbi:MAG: NnrS family protein, partial [Verrucomicrobia bacterium]|nr:NnrS family protein [Verrucomicrobiota bacterium]
AGIYGLCAMIAVLGGRVTPAFTRNAMVREGRETRLPVSRKPLELAGVALAIALPIVVMIGVPDRWTAVLMLACGILQLTRVMGWRPGFAAQQPILWSLHLSFALVGVGLILTGLALLGFGSEVAALHVTAIAGVAGMTLAVMSRATFGHSGRPLVAPRMLVAAYALLPMAAAWRWVASEVSGAWYFPGVVGAGVLWILAFAFYAVALWPAFWGPRIQAEE